MKIESVIDSCVTNEQLVTCENWIIDLKNRGMISIYSYYNYVGHIAYKWKKL